VVLRGNENQSWAFFGGTRLLLLRSSAEGVQDADDRGISGQNANSNGGDYREAENQRHEERNQDQPPYPKIRCQNAAAGGISISLNGFFNLPALTLAAIDD
jgi:hypothetical protein